MKNNYIVYKYTSPSGKVYIGQTNQGLYKRYRCGQGYKHSTYFYNAILKYGIENFQSEILKDNLSLEEANYWEIYFISQYDATNREKGYNISPGGNNHKISEEGRQRLSERMKKK